MNELQRIERDGCIGGKNVLKKPEVTSLHLIIAACIKQGLDEAKGKFYRDVLDKDRIQKEAIDFVFSDEFDMYCEFVGKNPDILRAEL